MLYAGFWRTDILKTEIRIACLPEIDTSQASVASQTGPTHA